MKKILEYISTIKEVDRSLDAEVQKRLDNLTKPPGSLGRLEETVKEFARMTGKTSPSISKKRIFIMAGDHAIAQEGVSAFPAEVTPQMVLNFLSGGAAINVLARHAGCETKVVDMGVNFDFGSPEGLTDMKVKKGAANFMLEPAMTGEELVAALDRGIKLAEEAVADGVDIIGTGDMGIANTTPSTAIYSALFGIEPKEITGPGTGLDEAGVSRKADIIKKAVSNRAPFESPFDILMKVGGLEIAGITGLIFGAAKHNLPVVVDGFISTAGAAVAIEAVPAVRERLFFAHASSEPGHAVVLEKIGATPLLDLGMRLGEGTGAALAIPIIEASLKIFNEMASFDSAGVSGAL
jgi:nicotinate-nucleotide--dimethylbenzimidazole phosphoribosyltransferase